jgi:hypothetical protein
MSRRTSALEVEIGIVETAPAAGGWRKVTLAKIGRKERRGRVGEVMRCETESE